MEEIRCNENVVINGVKFVHMINRPMGVINPKEFLKNVAPGFTIIIRNSIFGYDVTVYGKTWGLKVLGDYASFVQAEAAQHVDNTRFPQFIKGFAGIKNPNCYTPLSGLMIDLNDPTVEFANGNHEANFMSCYGVAEYVESLDNEEKQNEFMQKAMYEMLTAKPEDNLVLKAIIDYTKFNTNIYQILQEKVQNKKPRISRIKMNEQSNNMNQPRAQLYNDHTNAILMEILHQMSKMNENLSDIVEELKDLSMNR